MVTETTIVILAAGEGTRMRSRIAKPLHPLCGQPLLQWPIMAARGAGADRIIVVDSPSKACMDVVDEDVKIAVQADPLGTGDAAKAALEHITGNDLVVILPGDVPLITPEMISSLLQFHRDSDVEATIATMELDDPTGYGRVIRQDDGTFDYVVETKVSGDATAAQLKVREVNSGVFVFAANRLRDALKQISPQNAQGEFYLPDALKVMRDNGQRIGVFEIEDSASLLGVNDRVDLGRVRQLAQARIIAKHQRAGVTIVDPASTLIDVDVEIGSDTVIEPSSFLRGSSTVGSDCTIGPLTTLIDCRVGDRVTVLQSYVDRADLSNEAVVGPFTYLRPDAILKEGAKAGAFVEIKNSIVGERAKVPHLSYIGDSEIGEQANIGAGSITANYDGSRKHRTIIGKRARVGVDSAFVAPVTVGDDAYTAAGSVIVADVPAGALGVARARQRNIDSYSNRISKKQQSG